MESRCILLVVAAGGAVTSASASAGGQSSEKKRERDAYPDRERERERVPTASLPSLAYNRLCSTVVMLAVDKRRETFLLCGF